MKGYKVFEVHDGGMEWESPYYPRLENWTIHSHRTIKTSDVDGRETEACGFGVNFYTSKKQALRQQRMHELCVVFEGHTTDGARVVCPHDYFNKKYQQARTNSFRLDKVVGYYYRGCQVKRLPPKKIRGYYQSLDKFYCVEWSDKRMGFYPTKL